MTSYLLSLVLALALPGAALPNQSSQTKPPATLEGKLVSLAGSGPTLKTAKKEYRLAGRTSYLFHTLQDKRLADHEVRLEGTEKSDGSFEVERIYTFHNGKLYRVRYYCEVCNIEALEPGDCVCCQQPTELQEIPVDDPSAKVIITPPE
jgi:hypothetical protein